MAMVEAKVNYGFHESEVDINQVLVTNNLGYAVSHLELVLLDKMFGQVVEFDGIADGASGMIDINPNRKISTTQIDVSDTFVVGNTIYFHVANKVLEDTSASGNVAVGTVTKVNNGTSVEFMPFVQRYGATGLVVT
ncbi:MAG: hypothetical protein DRP09_13825 [Candidatus Thorarchaeota archaeon]|nr:MAG: hypothetical protein DRP09_13825 [Candidatus Thorarchaeota archaeon]